MARKQTVSAKAAKAETYRHGQQAVQRPEVGVQEEFQTRKPPKTYRFDSSLDPQLSWDENSDREQAEWLLGLIERAANGDDPFARPQEWIADGTRIDNLQAAIDRLKSLSRPFLNWAGKAERHNILVPTVPLFVHERQSTAAILDTVRHRKAAGETLEMFADEKRDIAEKLGAYEYEGPWANRMILGDSLQVMNSLLEYEGLGGQVQMIYMDPPYGVKFGSNFQPFVRKRDVKHGKDEHMVREPEMVKAYRDTWELGIHSYLSYLRDRLMVAKDLLNESGSIFVQISDENLHHVREVLDEVFGDQNFSGIISFYKTSSQSTSNVQSIVDYLLIYAKNSTCQKVHKLLRLKYPGDRGAKQYTSLISLSGKRPEYRRMTEDEIAGTVPIPEGYQVCALGPATSAGYQEGRSGRYLFQKEELSCPANRHWSYDPNQGGEMDKLAKKGRLRVSGNSLRTILLLDDNPTTEIDNVWLDTGTGSFTENQVYSVQTAQKVIQRCVLMTTDPGDLVLDPTCGSGTTAYVAEQWGRRWITCDTSRVPLALVRQRLLTATFPWYELAQPQKGPAGDFVYKQKQNKKGEEVGGLVPHITLKSIANGEEPKLEKLVDRPEVQSGITRVAGPFTVEATIPAAAQLDDAGSSAGRGETRTHIDRMIEVLRQSKTLRLPGNRTLNFEQVRPVADSGALHADAVENNGREKRVAILFGPEDGAVTSDAVFEAAREAYFLKYDHLYVFGFAIQARACELVEDRSKLRIPASYVSVTPDVVMSDLLKTTRSSEIFSITGLPDIDLKPCKQKSVDGAPLYQVELRGLDIFNPVDMETESIEGRNLPAWMLDTNYNGLCFYASQVFFPKTSAWDNLKKSLGASLEDSVWDHLAGTLSEPFEPGEHRKIAVKVIDARGNELMAVRDVAQ